MEISTGMAVGGGVVVVLLLVGVYVATRPDPAAAAPTGYTPYAPPAPPPAQDDTAQAVRQGLAFGGQLLERLVPSANDRLAAEQRDADRALERERLRLCLATPTAPICTQTPGGLAPRT